MKLIGDIKASSDPSLFARVCQTNVTDFPGEVFTMMNQQIQDNESLMIKMFGESIVKRVKLYV